MSDILWTSSDIAQATGGLARAPFAATGLSIDTRTLRPGDLFVALSDRRDGHDFVADAFKAGAAGALVSREVEAPGPLLVVADVVAALEMMGVAARARSGAVRVAITGSVGKTSVKEMLARIFEAAGPAHWPEKSFNNHWGVPLTLARMPEHARRAVFEIGTSTPGEIAPRSRLVRPDHALITRIAPAHLEGMGSVDAIADEKADIFAGLETNGTIALPSDDAFRERLAARARMHCPSGELACFGTDPEASARLTACETDGVSTHAEISLDGQKVRVRLAAVGQHWAMNATAALLLAVRTGLAPGDAAAALEGFTPPSGRGTAETLHLPGGGTAMLIDDAYNANPESMRAALAALAARPANRHLAALGEMLEMGEASAAGHSGLSGPVSAAGLDTVFLAGGEMAALGEALDSTIRQHRATTAADLEETVKNTLADGDVLLIKGSNASGMAKLADRLRQWSEASRPADVMERRPEGAARGDDAV